MKSQPAATDKKPRAIAEATPKPTATPVPTPEATPTLEPVVATPTPEPTPVPLPSPEPTVVPPAMDNSSIAIVAFVAFNVIAAAVAGSVYYLFFRK